jgi:ABC-type cobalamin/Fe3+-siderophores transport system ATPase subunit
MIGTVRSRAAKATVLIKKLEVEEGFLDGLSVEFQRGLNVVIGPRGVGKTSLIEVLRYAFGVPGYTERSNSAALSHVRSVLAGGRVTVTVEDNGALLTLVRAADDRAPRAVGVRHATTPIILSQNEIEQIGLEASSRMRLLDGFRPRGSTVSETEEAALAMVSSLTAEIQSISRAARAAEERLLSMADVADALEHARREELEVSATVAASGPERQRLDALSQEAAAVEVRREALERATHAAGQWMKAIETLRSRIPEVQWPSAAGDRSEVLALEEALLDSAEGLSGVARKLRQPIARIHQAAGASQMRLVELQDESRHLRRKLEQLAEGAGQASHRVATLQAQLAKREALREEAGELKAKVVRLRDERSRHLRELAAARDKRVAERQEAAEQINAALGPVVHVRVDRDAGISPYVEAITDLLQGSGLHYNTLAPQLAKRVSPREFAEAVELGQVEQLAGLAGITEDRAARVIASADKRTFDRVLTARIDDRVEITLLDESVPKPTQSLSTGQRCTAVLPILLLHDERILILDQPEDHLDNAYVVDTLVRSLKRRSDSAQTIVATHNANIPVLGDASCVVLLGSDGRRGFVRLAAPLTSPEAVSAISQVMEGGAEAFKLRAKFYSQYLG